MKHFLLSLWVLCALAPTCLAQVDSDSMVPYHVPMKLMHSDFLGNQNSPYDYTLRWGMQNKVIDSLGAKFDSLEIRGTRYHYFIAEPYFDKGFSFIKEGPNSEANLRFCQLAMDVVDLYCLRFTIEYNNSLMADRDAMLSQYNHQGTERIEEIKRITNNGLDLEELSLQEALIAHERSKIHFDPSEVEIGSPRWSNSIQLGLNVQGNLNSNFSPIMPGFFIGYYYGYKRHLFGIDVSANFAGRFKEEMIADNGNVIPDDSRLASTRAVVTYGYRVNTRFDRALYAICNAGVGTYNAPSLYDDEKKEATGLENFHISAGIQYYLPLTRDRYLNGTQFLNALATDIYKDICIQPTIGATYLGSGKGWAPVFNLSIAFCFRTVKLR